MSKSNTEIALVPASEKANTDIAVYRSSDALTRSFQDTLADCMHAVGTMLADGGDGAQRAAAKKWYQLASGLVIRARMQGWTTAQLRIALLSHLPDVKPTK